MDYLYSVDGITGFISKSDLDALPTRIRDDFLASVSITETSDDYITFKVQNESDANRLNNAVKKFERGKRRSESRRTSLNLYSGGLYEKEDIEQLFIAQEGLCYYTRQPLTKDPKNFEIDHIIPVAKGGSSWPDNLALAIKTVNQDKNDWSKDTVLFRLGKQYGQEWLKSQREYCKRVNARRKIISEQRKKPVFDFMHAIELKLKAEFTATWISYSISPKDDSIKLEVDDIYVSFPPGFIRQKKLFKSYEYISGIVKSILIAHINTASLTEQND